MPAYKYKLKSGKQLWYSSFRYTDWTGEKQREVKRGFLTKREALDYETHFKDSLSKQPTLLFSSLAKNYFEDCETRLKPTTLSTKRYLFDQKILPYFANTRTCDISVAMVRKWQNEMINYRDSNGKPYSQTYLKTMNNQLCAILNFACRYYGLAQNPVHAAGTIGKSHADDKPFWTHEQYRQFREYEKKPSYLLAFDLLFYGGIREGELLALTPEDFDRRETKLRIDENYAVVDNTEYILTPKTQRSHRLITLPKTIFDEATAYIDKLGIQDGERIFYFTKKGLLAEFYRATKRAGLPKIRIHDLRGSHASMLAEMGVPIRNVSDRLGHESPSTTLRVYTHASKDKERELADRIDQMIADSEACEEDPDNPENDGF